MRQKISQRENDSNLKNVAFRGFFYPVQSAFSRLTALS